MRMRKISLLLFSSEEGTISSSEKGEREKGECEKGKRELHVRKNCGKGVHVDQIAPNCAVCLYS